MLNRRHLLATAALAPVAALAGPRLRPSIADEPSLRRAAGRGGLLYGCAVATYQLEQPDFKAALLGESAGLVAEYEMKRNAIEPQRGQFDFGPADALVDFAQVHGLRFRGHTLVWYGSNPAWLEPAVRASRDERLFTDYIARMMRRYGARVQSWDVVNEIMNPKDGRADGLRNSLWLETFGPGYIDTALHAARDAAPGVQLVYNDWGCELAGPEHDLFRAKTLKLLEGLKARNVPIDALGLQGHLPAFGKTVDQAALRRFLDEVRAMGLKILVTEHDVSDRHGPASIAARDRAVADASARFLDVVADNPATDAVLTWGLSDRFLRAEGWRAELTGRRPRMLPLDYNLQRTAMWRAMRRAFAGRGV